MVTGPWPLPCENWAPRWVIAVRTGQPWPVRCKRNTCPYCLPRNAAVRTLAIIESKPERMILLTLLAAEGDANPFQRARIRVKRLREQLRADGIEPGEWSWTLEHNPEESGYHAHVLQHGSYIPQEQLSSASETAKAGAVVRVQKVKWVNGAAYYGTKGFGACGYGMKKFHTEADAMHALRINGGAVEHHSRQFFRVDGIPTNVKDVERVAKTRKFPAARTDYIVCSPDEANRYLDGTGVVALGRQGRNFPGVLPISLLSQSAGVGCVKTPSGV